MPSASDCTTPRRASRSKSCRTVPTGKPDCLASSRRCSRSARTPHRRRDYSAFTFEESKSACGFIMCGITIRSCGYTRQNNERRAPLQRTIVVIAALCPLGGDLVEAPYRSFAACGDMATARVKRALSFGNALRRAAGTPAFDAACRSGSKRAGSETGAPARHGQLVAGKMSAKSANATSMRHQSHLKACW